jgi:hypothetical protein
MVLIFTPGKKHYPTLAGQNLQKVISFVNEGLGTMKKAPDGQSAAYTLIRCLSIQKSYVLGRFS